jgi:putative ABC transport system substrate-binding protein
VTRFGARALVLAVAVLGAPTAIAQAPVVGVLAIGTQVEGAEGWDRVFAGGLRRLGYITGKTVVIEYRWAHGDIARYPGLARELINLRAQVIVAPCGPSLRAIREISRTVAVVANCADEKNFLGEVATLARPGGYTTGMTFLSPESVGKRIELLREMIPGMTRLAVLYQPDDPIPAHWIELERLQSRLGLVLQRIPFESPEDLSSAFDKMTRERAQALVVFPTNRIVSERAKITELARKHRIPAAFEFPFFVDGGGLFSYGASVEEWLGKTTVTYVDRILKGVKAGDLPIVQPTQFELHVNLKTAREIGVKVPQSILVRADRVIE